MNLIDYLPKDWQRIKVRNLAFRLKNYKKQKNLLNSSPLILRKSSRGSHRIIKNIAKVIIILTSLVWIYRSSDITLIFDDDFVRCSNYKII